MSTQPLTEIDSDHPRTLAMLHRLQQAMSDIEADIAAHHGVYPYNHGRVTQSELCRRADVKKATLQTPLHKDTTRVEVIRWLDALAGRLAGSREATRERVTGVADNLAAEVARLAAALVQAEQTIAHLTAENVTLRQLHAAYTGASSADAPMQK